MVFGTTVAAAQAQQKWRQSTWELRLGLWSLVLAVMEWEHLDTAWRGTFDFVNEHNIKAAKLLYSSAVTDTTIISNYQTLDSFCSELAKKQSWVFSTFSVKLKVDETEKFDRMGQWWMLTDLQRQSKNMYLKDIIQHYLKITGFKQSLVVLASDLAWHYLILSTTALPRPRIKYAWAQIVRRWRLVQRGDDHWPP